MQQQHQQQLDRGGFGGPPSYSSYAVGSAAGNETALRIKTHLLHQLSDSCETSIKSPPFPGPSFLPSAESELLAKSSKSSLLGAVLP